MSPFLPSVSLPASPYHLSPRSGHHHTVVCVHGSSMYVLRLIPSPSQLSPLAKNNNNKNWWLLTCLLSFAFSRMPYSWIIKYVEFSDWLLSLSNIHLNFSECFPGLIANFLLVANNILLFGSTSLVIPSPTIGHLCCRQVWAIMNKAVLNICEQVFVWT